VGLSLHCNRRNRQAEHEQSYQANADLRLHIGTATAIQFHKLPPPKIFWEWVSHAPVFRLACLDEGGNVHLRLYAFARLAFIPIYIRLMLTRT
jgi:hypothetical protein